MNFPFAPTQSAVPPKKKAPKVDRGTTQPATDLETDAYLITETPEEADYADALWRESTGQPGLIDAQNIPQKGIVIPGISPGIIKHARVLQSYFWDFLTGRYRYAGSYRLVPEARIQTDMLRMSIVSRNRMRAITLDLKNETITLDKWYNSMRAEMKAAYRNAWIVSIGGKGNYDKRQQALFGRAVKSQYAYLDNFLREIVSGKQPLNGRAVARAGMYGDAANVVYQNNRLKEAGTKFKEGRRVRTAAESCPTCVREAKKGWMAVEKIVPLGNSECRSNCRCFLEFRTRKASVRMLEGV